MNARAIRLFLLVTLLCYPLWQGHAADRCEPWVGQLVSVEGRVDTKRAGSTHWKAAQIQDNLCAGDSVRVAPRSRATMRLRNDTTLRLDQETTVTLSKIMKQEPSLLELILGTIYSISRTPQSLKVRTPFVNAAIKGTEFLLRAEESQASVAVFEGQVLASNEHGSVALAGGEMAVAQANQAPRLQLIVRPTDAVEWALYYPPLVHDQPEAAGTGPGTAAIRQALTLHRQGDLPAALAHLETVPTELRDSRFFNLKAGLLLSVGRVDEARSAIEQALRIDPGNGTSYALQAVIAVAQNTPEQALTLAGQAVEADPRSPLPWVALSYAHQSDFAIEEALHAAQKSVALDPDNALAWARLAELWLAQGDLDQALDAARMAAARNPDLARTQTVLGFAHLTRIEIEEAENAFGKAILTDQANPLPRLGRSLAKIRRGKLADGRRDIEIAAALDPLNSLARSYLGKAYFEERRDHLAGTELDRAKALDGKDPTPWYYDAIRKQTQNRPVEALHDLQRSIELNDNRAVYRSRLLLDQDLATRGTSLARIYDDLGFDQLAQVEASKSLSIDPANHSAHRFLSDSYASRPRHEIARVSELLQAQLLQPVNINPVQPRLTATDLNIISGTGPAEAAFNEFTPLFERNRAQVVATGVVGNNDTVADEVVVSGLHNRFSYSAGQFHYETDGFRENNDLKHDIYNLFGQWAVSTKINLQAEIRRRETDHGDLRLQFDPDVFSPNRRVEIDQDIARLGARFAPSPESDVIASLSYIDAQEATLDAIEGLASTSNSTDDHGYQAETQYLLRTDAFNITTGIGTNRLNRALRRVREFTIPGFPVLPVVDSSRFSLEHHNAYLYSYLPFAHDLSATLGLSYDAYDGPALDLNKASPKAGLEWQFTDAVRLRLAAMQTIKRTLTADQTLEPTQIAGFNQFFDDKDGTEARRYAIGLDTHLANNLYGGLEVSQRVLEVPTENPTEKTVTFEQHREYLYRAYLYWTPRADWAFSAEPQFERFERERFTTVFEEPIQLDTLTLPLSARYFHPSGLFAQFGASYIHQDVERLPLDPVLKEGRDDFIVLDAALGYRLPKRKGIISVEAKNLLDEEFLFQDTDFQTSETTNPRFIPDRLVLLRVTLSF